MAFDQRTRNLLQRTVSSCRRILDREFTAQLQELYGIQPDGALVQLATLDHLGDEELEVARLLRERINHFEGGSATEALNGKSAKSEHIERVIREQAFTVLNRLAALRLCEERGLVLECVRRGVNSEGFQLFNASAGNALGATQEVYREYLHCLFDELSVDLGVLFDRFSPLALIFPRQDALTEVLKELNASGQAVERDEISAEQFAEIWQVDETLGWIYQYYNDEAERKIMREASAPRSSRELAVRNQFFTPRYVVQYLTDNTLGRIWYEMTEGETNLTEHCSYLVRLPTEIILDSEVSAGQPPNQINALQQEVLVRPVPPPHRALKDPRTIRMLDPACGSMHFGLYAFDLFEIIYDEAWKLEEAVGSNAEKGALELKSLHATYSDKHAFLKDVPRLIIENNIYGIDIDPRCVQIAALSLWLRAQKTWQRAGLEPRERPNIRRSNIVCAEPMPGEKELLHEFVEREFSADERKVFRLLLETIFEKMLLAAEAGSLLKIEEEIRDAITEAKRQWNTRQRARQESLFPVGSGVEQAEFRFDFSGITDEQFWTQAEERLYAALREFAEQSENTGSFQRRLFAEDTARGFGFIDLCRKRYDVVVMNPPFGYPSENSKAYVDKFYSKSKYDVLAAFIDRAGELLLSTGQLGCITSRTVFFIEFFADWRLQLFSERGLQQFADLGFGVLDALVETAAFTFQNSPSNKPANFIRLLSSGDKKTALSRCVSEYVEGRESPLLFVAHPHEFSGIDGSPLAYWVPRSFRSQFESKEKMQRAVGEVRVGLQTGDDFRFIRTAWEVNAKTKGRGRYWSPLAKGGEFRKFYDDIHLVVNWDKHGSEIINCVDERGKQRSRPQNVACYYRPGLTYPMRTTSNYSPRVLPSGCIFNVQGNSVFVPSDDGMRLLAVLGVLSTLVFESFTRLKARVGDMTSAGGAGFAYTPGLIGSMPFPALDPYTSDSLEVLVLQCVNFERFKDTFVEPSGLFVVPTMLSVRSASLRAVFESRQEDIESRELLALEAAFQVELLVQSAYDLTEEDRAEVREQFGVPVASLPIPEVVDEVILRRLYIEGITADFVAVNASQQRQLSSTRHLRIDEICRVTGIPPNDFVKARKRGAWIRIDEVVNEAAGLAQYLFGCAFGRWDIRYATGEEVAPGLPDPFEPLPVCPPGQLQNERGLPADPEDVSVTYPVRIPWDGIIVDDQNHTLDVERNVREIIENIWAGMVTPERSSVPIAHAIEREICEMLGVNSLRDYFRKTAGFFSDHLKRYSKSRRQAPIYWPLSTASGSYTLWIYYHRLTHDTLYKCVQQFVNPKLGDVEKDLANLRMLVGANEGSAKERIRVEELETLRRELIDLRAELELWAPKWKPNLNDGVLITAAPLWKLFRLQRWQKDLKACWEELERGDYDWAHLAYSLWPDRVREKCRTDRSIAIAHGLEELCEVKAPIKKSRKAKVVVGEIMPEFEIGT